MKRNRLPLLALIGILILACNFPALGPAATNPPDTALPTAAQAADVATDTPAPTAIPTLTLAPTISVPSISPDGQPVNCRSGPGLTWDVLVILQVGRTAEIAAKIPDGTWLEVKNPLQAGSFCWVSASVVKTTGDLSGVQVVAAPPTPIPPTAAAIVVTDLSVSISPTTISVAGCVGPVPPSTITATITVNGPTKLQWHFETEQTGKLPSHNLNFLKADSKGVTQSFTPPLKAGTYTVELFITGMDLSGMDNTASYKIKC